MRTMSESEEAHEPKAKTATSESIAARAGGVGDEEWFDRNAAIYAQHASMPREPQRGVKRALQDADEQ